MYLMYIDESGDVGQINSSNRYFILSALIIHESNWFSHLEDLNDFRTHLKRTYGLLKNEEIHAAVFANGRPKLKNNIPHFQRINILFECLNWLSKRKDLSIITVRNDKNRPTTDIFYFTWQTMIQRFENTLQRNNFIHPTPIDNKEQFFRDQRGIIFSDNTDGGKLRKILRKMRHINYVPSMFGGAARDIPIEVIIEDEIMRDSRYSYIHQMADVVAYFAKQVHEPNNFFKKHALQNAYGRLMPVINPYATSKSTPYKMVEI
jgi:hypothetical protein